MSRHVSLLTSAAATLNDAFGVDAFVKSSFFCACARTTSTPRASSCSNQSSVTVRTRPGRVVHDPDVVVVGVDVAGSGGLSGGAVRTILIGAFSSPTRVGPLPL